MAKVKVTKKTEPVNGPGGRILTDDQVESWSDFAQKNQNLNFDQKWDAFSKMNPKFGASKNDLSAALQKHSNWLSNTESERLDRTMSGGYRSGPMGEKQKIKHGDVFMPLYDNGKIVARYGESGELLDKYKKPSQVSNSILSYRQIPSLSNVDLGSYNLDRSKGVADVITNEGKNIKLNVNDLLQHPEWKTFVAEKDSEYLRSQKAPKQMMVEKGPSIFRK